jgi:cell division protein FtsW
MKPYQQRRITGFLESWANFEDAPYQLKQSLVTLGTGGLHGVGLGRGWQKLSFLPEANTDFVFAVIGEELGLIGTISLVALWCGLYLAGLRMLGQLDRQRFAFLASFTLLTQLTAQALLNVAVVTAMVPPKGISHPLISAGGSNLVASLLAIGIVISLSREAPEEALPEPVRSEDLS